MAFEMDLKLCEARREGYIQALKDLLNDGILSSEEFKKRETEQMGKPLFKFSSPIPSEKPTFGGQPNTSVSTHGFSFGSVELRSSSGNSNAPSGGSPSSISFSFGQSDSPSKFSTGNTSPFSGSTSSLFSFGQTKPSSSSLNNTSTSPFGGSTMPSFSFSTAPSLTPTEFDIRAASGATSFSFGGINPITSGDNNQENSDNDVDELAAQMESSTIQVPDFVFKGNAIPVSPTGTIPSFKITLVGDGGVGKTAWINQLKTDTFEKKYVATVGVSVVPLMVNTNNGPVALNVWDTAGQEKFGGLRDGYYTGSNGFVIMFDVTSRVTYKNVPNWYRDITRENPDRPVVLVGNKCDVKDRQVKAKMITFHRKKNLQYYDMSVRSGFNIEKPFQHLLRVFTGDINLQFVSTSGLKPYPLPEVNISKETLERLEKELKEASVPPLDEDEL